MAFTVDDMPGFFEKFGWKYERPEPSVFRTGFAAASGTYDVWVKCTDEWVYFAINPYIAKVEGREHGSETLRAILRANHDVNLVKLAVDSEGDVCLVVELPQQTLTYGQFADALAAIAHYADACQARLRDGMRKDAATQAGRLV